MHNNWRQASNNLFDPEERQSKTSDRKYNVKEYLAEIKRQGLISNKDIPALLRNTPYSSEKVPSSSVLLTTSNISTAKRNHEILVNNMKAMPKSVTKKESFEKILETANRITMRLKNTGMGSDSANNDTNTNPISEEEMIEIRHVINRLLRECRVALKNEIYLRYKSELNMTLKSESTTSNASYYSAISNICEVLYKSNDIYDDHTSSGTSASLNGDFDLNVSCRRSSSDSSLTSYYSMHSSQNTWDFLDEEYVTGMNTYAIGLQKTYSYDDTSISSNCSNVQEELPNGFLNKLQNIEPFGYLLKLFSNKLSFLNE